MTENDIYTGQRQTGAPSSAQEASRASGASTGSVGDTMRGASRAALDEAKSLGGEAQHVAAEQADKVKDIAASQMDVFADALKAASEQLSKDHSGPAAEMVAHAASGLEEFSRSLHGKSTGEMLETVRQFGRTNPIGFLAGSVLAGVALGRFAAAGAPASKTGTTSAAPSTSTSTSTSTTADRLSQHQDRGMTP